MRAGAHRLPRLLRIIRTQPSGSGGPAGGGRVERVGHRIVPPLERAAASIRLYLKLAWRRHRRHALSLRHGISTGLPLSSLA